MFRTLPMRREILQGLLGADLLGFHVYDYARHFLHACTRLLGSEVRLICAQTPDANPVSRRVRSVPVDHHIHAIP